jgi:hypothetical protein
MSALKPEVRKRMMIVYPITIVFLVIAMGVLMMQGAPTSVVAFVGVGIVIFAALAIFAYAWPHMTVDAGQRCPRCGAEIREDFIVCPACTMSLKPR